MMRLATSSRRVSGAARPCSCRACGWRHGAIVHGTSRRWQVTERRNPYAACPLCNFPSTSRTISGSEYRDCGPSSPSLHRHRTRPGAPREPARARLRNFIGGEYVDGRADATTDVVNPATGQVVATAPVSGQADVDAAYAAADRAFDEWGRTTPSERQQALLKFADAIEAHADELIALESENTGKIQALTASEEIPPMVDQLRFFAGAARVLEGKAAGEYMAGHTSWIRREPIGVVGQVTPWNYPLMMAVWKIAPGPRRRQHRRPQAERHDARDARCCWPSSPPSSSRPARSTSSPATARPAALLVEHPTPGPRRDHRLGPRRRRGRRQRRPERQAGAPRARRQGAGRRLRRRRHRGGRRGHRRSPATSTPARTARRPPASSPPPASTTTSSPRSRSTRGARHRSGCPTTRTPSSARSTTPPAAPG